ncbi:hypothetical protein L195_g012781, partial [Trifolium pratense]
KSLEDEEVEMPDFNEKWLLIQIQVKKILFLKMMRTNMTNVVSEGYVQCNHLDAEPSETEALLYEFSLPLMADLFDNFQDKTDLVEGDLLFLHLYFPNFLLQAKEMGFYGSKGGQRTIIFNPRVCDNVDLEVGSLIRIHPPWKFKW